MKKYLVFISIGFELVFAVLISTYLGDIIEKKYETKGLATMAIVFIVLAGWFIHIYYLLKKTQSKDGDGA